MLIYFLVEETAELAFDGGWVEAPRGQELDELKGVVASILGHHKLVPRSVYNIKKVSELVDREAEEVAVGKGLEARVLCILAVLLYRIDVEEEFLAHEAAEGAGLVEQRDLRGVVAEALADLI